MRVLVLGGGCAGLAAAWQLSCTPQRRAAIEVTVASMGWRLGGKGTTGRSPRHGQRIHEHGLHVWMGWYRNAFAITAAALEAWRAPPGTRLTGIEAAFSPAYTVSLHDRRGTLTHLALPPRPGRPWSEEQDLGDWVRQLVRWRKEHLLPALSATEGSALATQVSDLGRFAGTVGKGLISEGLRARGRPDRLLARLDAHDLQAWLRRHGATDPNVHDNALVRAFYNLAFAYPEGRSGFGRGEVAAGAALSSLGRMALTYRGAPLYRMRAGMGDTVFVPLYEVLRDRGVRFELFRKVEDIEARDGRVHRVRLGVQAEAPDYAPLVEVEGERCWPDAPLLDQLEAVAEGDLESHRSGVLRHEIRELGRDYDAVVLAIPVPVHPHIAPSLMAQSPAYRRMVESHRSVVTVAAQLWSQRPLDALGWQGPPTIAVNGPGPLSSWAEMSEVLEHEAWSTGPHPGPAPESLLYFVDTAPAEAFEGMDRREAARAFRARVLPWLAGPDFPRTDSGLCHGPLREGESALAAQYFRANTDPHERYVLTPPGSTVHRLGPESGFEGLWLAGDWTRTSINGGSVEAAAESGRRAGERVVAAAGLGSGSLAEAPC